MGRQKSFRSSVVKQAVPKVHEDASHLIPAWETLTSKTPAQGPLAQSFAFLLCTFCKGNGRFRADKRANLTS